MIYDNADEAIEKIFESLLNRYEKHQWDVVILSLIVFIYCIMNVLK